MDLEKGVSVVLSFNRPILDELQYIGNVKVDFDYNQECYALKGTWYQVQFNVTASLCILLKLAISLFLSKMIAKLERALNTRSQNYTDGL